MTPAKMRDARNWKQGALWAANLPMTMFGDVEDMGPWGTAFAYDGVLMGVPSVVENSPNAAWDGWKVEPYPKTFSGQVRIYSDFVSRVAAAMPPGRIWLPCGDADGGICAIAAARGRKAPVVCLAASPPGILAAAESKRMGVPISYREKSGSGVNHV